MQVSGTEAVTDSVLSASRALVSVAARSLAAVSEEVTLPQYRVLVVLCSHGPSGMGALAQALEVSPSTATRLCDRLVRSNLIERRPREENRREVEVMVSAAGRRLVGKVTRRRRTEISRIVDHVPPTQQTAMIEGLRAFAAAAGELPDQAWASGWDL